MRFMHFLCACLNHTTEVNSKQNAHILLLVYFLARRETAKRFVRPMQSAFEPINPEHQEKKNHPPKTGFLDKVSFLLQEITGCLGWQNLSVARNAGPRRFGVLWPFLGACRSATFSSQGLWQRGRVELNAKIDGNQKRFFFFFFFLWWVGVQAAEACT